MSTARRVLAGLAAGAAILAPVGPRERAHADGNVLAPIAALIAGLDYDDARAMIAGATAAAPDDPRIALERGRLALYELDCDGAAGILGRPEVQKIDRDQVLGDTARGCQRVTAALAGTRDEVRAIEVHWQDENDAPLAPILMDTVDAARRSLTRDLGVDWPRPTRVVVVRDLLSLSAMTGLPYESARTTGTVAVAKWGRITLLSPRANRYGFPWRDTVAHELTHLAVTRATRDQAPLWLQEGVAKREETRWRAPGPFDDRPPPELVAWRGIGHGLGLPLDRLGPSIAMLPSAEAATVAFAEVTSFVRFYVETNGDSALPRLFQELKDGKPPNQALLEASGGDLKAWDGRWRTWLDARAKEEASTGSKDPTIAEAGDATAAGAGDGPVKVARDVRNRVRLAELLLLRGDPEAALKELDRMSAGARSITATDPMVRDLRGRIFMALGRAADAEPWVADPSTVSASYAPWWALRGDLARSRGDGAMAASSFAEAVEVGPLSPEAACETWSPTGSLPNLSQGVQGATPSPPRLLSPEKVPLCDAARAYALPPFEGE